MLPHGRNPSKQSKALTVDQIDGYDRGAGSKDDTKYTSWVPESMDMTAEQASQEDRKCTFWVQKSMDMTVEQTSKDAINMHILVPESMDMTAEEAKIGG